MTPEIQPEFHGYSRQTEASEMTSGLLTQLQLSRGRAVPWSTRPCCVALDKWFRLSESQFCPLFQRENIADLTGLV